MPKPLPEVKVLRSANLIDFLDYCKSWDLITEADKHEIISCIGKQVRIQNDTYVSGLWLYDAQEYYWPSNAELMHLIGAEFRKMYPERVDILWLSW